MKEEIAFVTRASTKEGIEARLKEYSLTESIAANSLAIVHGRKRKYLALISEIFHSQGAEKAHEVSKMFAGSEEERKTAEITASSFKSTGKFSTSLILIPLAQTSSKDIEDVDTIPEQASTIFAPDEEDMELFYGRMDNRIRWGIGYAKHPDKETQLKTLIPINLDILSRGSFGIFGKSGTGKTHLGNMLSSLFIVSNKSNAFDKKVKLLIFDMHSEYGLMVKDQQGNDYAEGVGQLFRNEFKIYTPDHALAKEFGLLEFNIDPREIMIEDLITLQETLELSDSFIAYLGDYKKILNDVIGDQYKEKIQRESAWILYLLGKLEEIDEIKRRIEYLEEQVNRKINDKAGAGASTAFKAGKSRLSQIGRYEFINENKQNSLDEILYELFHGERSIIISMGRYEDDAKAYTLIAQLLSRKIWKTAISMIMRGERLSNKIIIFLEEAHKFLSPELYYKTAFGNIARELRKRGIILCIIDQRPSELAEDVMAMLWNNFVFTLTEERDIEAATRGLKYSNLYLPVINTLKRKEALIFGEAIRLPAILSIRDYKEFIKEIKEYYNKLRTKLDLPNY